MIHAICVCVIRFLADRYVEGTCPLCGFEVSNKERLSLKYVVNNLNGQQSTA